MATSVIEVTDVTDGIERFERDGLGLALHHWLPERVDAVLFYVHGIQSHGGWLFETGPYLASRGVAVYVLDRRGSGASEGVAGGSEPEAWIADYAAALAHVRGKHRGVPLTMLGQSFGGTLAAAVAVHAIGDHDALVFVAPALNQLRGQRIVGPGEAPPPLPELVEHELVPIPLEDRQYTKLSRYLDFMRGDPKMLRTISRNHRRAQLALAAEYMRDPAVLRGKPAALFLPRTDEIISLPIARETFALLAPNGVVIELPTDDHYLEFSAVRVPYLELLLGFVRAPARFLSAE